MKGRPLFFFVCWCQQALLYLIALLDPLVKGDYIILYFHTLTEGNNHPSMAWMREVYNVLEYKYKKNLKGFYIIHPTFWTKVSLFLSLSLSLSLWPSADHWNLRTSRRLIGFKFYRIFTGFLLSYIGFLVTNFRTWSSFLTIANRFEEGMVEFDEFLPSLTGYYWLFVVLFWFYCFFIGFQCVVRFLGSPKKNNWKLSK